MSAPWKECVDLDGRPASPVRWTPATPPDDRHELPRWREAVGPVRVGNVEGGGAAGWPLTVAVWNARVGGGAIRTLWDRLARVGGGESRSAASASPRPIVLLLQEVFATGPDLPDPAPGSAWASRIADHPEAHPRTDIVSFARDSGLSLLYAPSMRNGGPDGGPPEDRGNAILANVPLLAPRAIELPFERQRRVAVAASAAIGTKTVAFCSLHLDNRTRWQYVWRAFGSARRRQMAGLLNTFPGSAEADALVIGGDFNTWVRGRREGAYKLARRRFPLPEIPDPKPTHHFEIGGWLRHSDHLLFRLPDGWRGEYHRLDDTFGSDHYPLVGTLTPPA